MSHDPHHIPTPPTSFLRKYVFSTDHKVIGIQFTVASLFFVIYGGLLALGVRYQLAWPNQDVPFKWLLPGQMTGKAPEANLALWQIGKEVELSQSVQGMPAGTKATLTAFPKGLAVTLPAGTRVEDESEIVSTLREPVSAHVDDRLSMADYDYMKQNVLVAVGTTATTEDGRKLKLVGAEVLRPAVTGQPVAEIIAKPLSLPIRRPDTLAAISIAQQMVPAVAKEGQEQQSVAATQLELTADNLTYEKDSLTTDAYLQLFTMHATIMVFFVLMPMLMGGFGNFLIPLMIGARDMAFPKLNMLSFWLAAPSGAIILSSFWVLHGPAGGGWTMYPPLSGLGFIKPELGTDLWLIAITLVGFSTIVGTLNYITTIINMRAPGMSMFRMPLTIWSLLITSILALFATPVLTGAGFLLLFDRLLGTHFFTPASGGQPLLWQHLFWFFGHPEVYILILPAMGIASDILSVNSRKPIFGYKPMVFAICAIAGLGFIVWGHHMFQSGMNPVLGTTFMASTIMIAVPSAIKTFNWLGTLWGGNIKFTSPMLFAIGFVSMFVIGGLSGVFMAAAPVDIHIHDTYFIVGHIHYVFFGGTIMSVFAGVYHWYPKMFGTQMNERWAKVHFWGTLLGMNGTFFIMHIIGIAGHPRRYASILEYPQLQHLQSMNVIMSVWAIALGAAQIPFFFNFFASMPRRLGRALVALFVVLLGLPIVMGMKFWSTYDPTFAEGAGNLGAALSWSVVYGILFAAAATIATFIVWMVGGMLKVRVILEKALYVIMPPLFLSPIIIKPDIFILSGQSGLLPYRWALLGLLALAGVAMLVILRPRDVYGAPAGDNPWDANSLEWATSSPPPFHNFDEIPHVHRGPYEYSSPVADEDYLPQTKKLAPGVVEPTGH